MMIRLLYAPALVLAAVVLHGCADLQWSKPGADAAAVSRDLDNCRAKALTRSAPALAPAGSTEGLADRGSPRVMSPTASSNERFVAESEETRRCMQQRGYALR